VAKLERRRPRQPSRRRKFLEWLGFAVPKELGPAIPEADRQAEQQRLASTNPYASADLPRFIYEATIRNADILDDGSRNLETKGAGLVTLAIALVGLIGTLLDKELFRTTLLVGLVIVDIAILLAAMLVGATVSLPNSFQLPSPIIYNYHRTFADPNNAAKIYASLAESWNEVSRSQHWTRIAKGRRLLVAFILLLLGVVLFGAATSDALVERSFHSTIVPQVNAMRLTTPAQPAVPILVSHPAPTPKPLSTPIHRQ